MYVLTVTETSRPAPPLFAAYRLPLARRRQGPAATLSLVTHAAIALLLLWRGAELLQAGGGGAGPRGGGGGPGGGGRPAVAWFTIPAAAAPQVLDVPPAPAIIVPSVALPDPVKLDLSQLEPSPPAANTPMASGATASGGPGQSPGSGGGQGTGTGPGAGADAGPGSGGEAGYILADPNGVFLPPPCARGAFNIRFWVEADGRVSQVEVKPLPKDAGCRRDLIAALKAFRFRPARTRDGRAVASIFPFSITQ